MDMVFPDINSVQQPMAMRRVIAAPSRSTSCRCSSDKKTAIFGHHLSRLLFAFWIRCLDAPQLPEAIQPGSVAGQPGAVGGPD